MSLSSLQWLRISIKIPHPEQPLVVAFRLPGNINLIYQPRMNSERKKKLEAAGWKIGDYADFLGLTPEEKALVEIRLTATREMERLRAENPIPQAELARRMGMKQPNVSRLFKNPANATLDSIFRALLALGSTPKKIAALF